MKKKIIPFIIGALMLTGCDDLFSPAIENFQGVENMHNDAEYARGILHNVYSLIPGYYDNSEYGTDDAVTNQPSNVYLLFLPASRPCRFRCKRRTAWCTHIYGTSNCRIELQPASRFISGLCRTNLQ